MFKNFIIAIFVLLLAADAYSQVENVPLENDVYGFLKLMNVKQIIPSINDDDPNLSKGRVVEFLKQIESKAAQLSSVEKKLLVKYRTEFIPSEMNNSNSTQLFNPEIKFSTRISDLLKNKSKYLYYAEGKESTIYAEPVAMVSYANLLKPNTKDNTKMFDVGVRISGTLFKHLGYQFFATKGALWGQTSLAEMVDPRLRYNFKYVENNADENVRSFDYVAGYLKYYTEPAEKMRLSVQLGREKQKIGFGYSDRLVLSGDHPDMDFIKFTFDYGILHYTSLFASTVGEFSPNREDNYTKYFASNRLKLAFPGVIDVGIGESVISSRGIELAYLNPVIFYKFVEHSLQDRDNGTIFFDFQTQMIKNLQFQGMFFLDENILSNLSDFTKQSNKTAYQVGGMWYEPAGIKNLSLQLEYTKVRPYVYTHFNPKNTYTSFGAILGSSVGPNSDQIYSKLSYNLNEWFSVNLIYRKIRHGENEYDANGGLIKNVGGDVFQTYRPNIDSNKAYFLDGDRINTDIANVNLRIEPIRDYIFDINYVYRSDSHISAGFISDLSYLYVRFLLNY